MKSFFSIADMLIRIESDVPDLLNLFHDYNSSSGVPELELHITDVQKINSTYGICYTPLHEHYTHFLVNESSSNCRLFATEDWSHASLLCDAAQQTSQMELLAAAFYSRLSLFGGLLLHAAAVKYENKSIVFVGPSGVGKTTQAELWQKYAEAKILNGDKVFLREKSGVIHAYGSPWRGSSPYSINDSAPIAALVLLEQSNINSLQSLSGMNALRAFLPHVFYPKWDSACLSMVMKTLDKMTDHIPVYTLSCRPDAEAVMLLKDIL